ALQVRLHHFDLELLFVLRHVKTPEGWINIQLSGVSSRGAVFLCFGGRRIHLLSSSNLPHLPSSRALR
ncbi:hypothetical protein ACOTC8_29665, partial [Achromobacter xylosoxidans]